MGKLTCDKYDIFTLDGVDFSGIGHKMLKSTNQITYQTNPSRQIDGSMENINDFETFIQPKVEIGFKLIDMETFVKLRAFLLAKRIFKAQYYDKDFNKIVSHEVYAEPSDLSDFFSKGEDIIGIENYTIAFIPTLNEKELFTASFGDVTLSTKWGRSVTVPNGLTANGYWKITDTENYFSFVKFYPNDKMNVIDNCSLSWVSE